MSVLAASAPLWQQPAWLVPLVALLGLCVGSFLNVVIHRLPRMIERDWALHCGQPTELPALTLSSPPSHCPLCGFRLRIRDNLPLLSWLWLRGRCAGCDGRIAVRYPLVEALTALLSGLCAWHFGPTWALAGALCLVWGLVALAGIDIDTQLLPDDLTLPLLWLGLAFNLNHTFVPLAEAVIGAMAGYLVLWLVYWGFRLATGREGMGYGDFKLLAALGAWLGWQKLPLLLLVSSLSGAVVGVALIVFARHGRHVPIPFGPYLALAGVLGLFMPPFVLAF